MRLSRVETRPKCYRHNGIKSHAEVARNTKCVKATYFYMRACKRSCPPVGWSTSMMTISSLSVTQMFKIRKMTNTECSIYPCHFSFYLTFIYIHLFFLVADTQLYKSLCPSIRPLVGWSVGRLVRHTRVEKWKNAHFRPCPPVRN